jgi:hypothetical protein
MGNRYIETGKLINSSQKIKASSLGYDEIEILRYSVKDGSRNLETIKLK